MSTTTNTNTYTSDPNLYVIHTNSGQIITTDTFSGYLLMLYFQHMELVAIVSVITLITGICYIYYR